MTFEAKYADECSTCWEPIEVGQVARYEGGSRIVHDVCPTLPAAREVCPRCFMERSLSGACGC